ncbi:MAG: transporter substrate-binding domain-containing protein [Lachnospiraceae bacterium]|nr:transporter substrate-binding domain-containing protein [Lachnospiraceae bacterium]
MLALSLTACGKAEEASAAEDTPAAEESVSAQETESAAEETTVESAAAEGEMGPLMTSIMEKGKIVVGTASGYPPYEFIDITSADQSVIGIDMALAQAIADELGVELEIQDMSFSSLLSSLPANTIDIAIAGIAPTDERKESMDFSDSYLFAEQTFIILKENEETYSTLEAFEGQTLAAEKSTTQEALCQELFPNNQLVSLEKVPDCILELKNGKVAGICVESIVGEQYVISDDTLCFASADTGRKKETAIALQKGNEDLLAVLNKVIQENKDNGNFDKWVEEYSMIAAENAAD